MCDRPLPQQQLCADLAGLVWVLPAADTDDDDEKAQVVVVVAWLRGFWATMAREWTTGIDVLRMEKFMLLVRRVLGASLVWMRVRPDEEGLASPKQQQQKSPTKRSTRGRKRAADGEAKKPSSTTNSSSADNNEEGAGKTRWNKTRVDAILGLLADWPFRPEEESKSAPDQQDSELMPKMVPVGLKLHALDIWVDEAEKAGLLAAQDGEQELGATTKEEEKAATTAHLSSKEVLQRLNELVKTLHAETQSPAARKRSKESLADERLPLNQKEGNEGDDNEWSGLDD